MLILQQARFDQRPVLWLAEELEYIGNWAIENDALLDIHGLTSVAWHICIAGRSNRKYRGLAMRQHRMITLFSEDFAGAFVGPSMAIGNEQVRDMPAPVVSLIAQGDQP